MANGVWIKIRNYKNYSARKDVKYPQWFSCSNRILEDPDFYKFTHSQICVWIWALSVASRTKNETVFINFEEAKRKARLKKSTVESALKKLSGAQIDILENPSVTDSAQIPPMSCDATGEGREGQDKTGDNREPELESSISPQKLFDLWNLKKSQLSRVDKLTETRKRKANARLKDYPEIDFWEDAIAKAVDIFGDAPESEWRFNFDALVHEEKLSKLVEGGYDFLKAKFAKESQTLKGASEDFEPDIELARQRGGV